MKRFKYLTLAALVAFAACDEGEETVVEPTPTGTISGVVTIEGTGASGVTVTLSSGQTATTDASGAYSFSGVSAGAYTVSLSGYASDVTFTSTAKAATIATSGQVATVNFDGSYVRTSAILGSVSGGGSGLTGVTVSISGQSSSSTTTDANGQYSFSGLRAGSYTVTISGYDASTYSFTSTTQSVTLGVGESQVVSFSGMLVTTAKITGRLFLDENDKNDNFDGSAVEENLAAPNIAITLEGGAVLDTITVETAADGTYEFTGLAAGTYRLTINSTDADIPGNVAYDTNNSLGTVQIVTVTTGSTATVNWPFDITMQAIEVSAFLGRDGVAPGVAPVAGVTLDLYPTEGDAVGGTNRLGRIKTDGTGTVTFRFARSADTSPAGAVVDNIVFAQRVLPLPANHSLNGETRIEIKYDPRDSLAQSPDTFDLLNTQAVLEFDAVDVAGNKLSNWAAALWRNDTTVATAQVKYTNASGKARFTVNTAAAAFPDTFFMRLSDTQPGANGHAFSQAATAQAGTVVNTVMLRVIHDGVTANADTVDAGDEVITYKDQNVTVRVHHEADDSTDTPVYTGGDNFGGVANTRVELYKDNGDGTFTSVRGPSTPAADGTITWFFVPTGNYVARARSTATFVDILNDTTATVTLDGAAQADTAKDLMGNAGFSTFAHKYDNVALTGTVQSVDGATPAAGIQVHVKATADNIQPDAGIDTMVTTGAGGTYTVAGLREGPFSVMVADSVTANGTVWSFFDTLVVASAPLSSGTADNADERNATRDIQGPGNVQTANFQAHRMDTKVQGVVVNDRDSDFNTLDPGEALAGVVVNLYSDVDGDGDHTDGETIVAVDTTDAVGAYGFSWLKEDNYVVQALSPANATVLRTLSATGAVTNTAAVLTAAAAGAGATLNQNGTRQVGNMAPPAQNDEFPRWNYLTGAAATDGGNIGGGGPNFLNTAVTTTPAHFVHLFSTGTVTGKVLENAAPNDPAVGVRVTITRCATSYGPDNTLGTADDAQGAPSPPAAGACTTKHGSPSPHIQNVDTDASGSFTFNGLLEGVYQIDVAPATGGYTNINTPGGGSYLATLQGDLDVETVPNFLIS